MLTPFYDPTVSMLSEEVPNIGELKALYGEVFTDYLFTISIRLR